MKRDKLNTKKILITKISKKGFGLSIGSSFGFGGWTIGGTTIEIEVDPPIDISTEEGQKEYKKLKESLGKMTLKALKEDIALACKQDKELNASITQRELLVNNATEEQ